ncbi:MAG: hypothetical protein K2X86_00065 [Cytophagaceae bacterium]|nr:hypothetical protein [Cytophagaceae bacterium]
MKKIFTFFIFFITCTNIFSQKTDKKILLGINFPGAGYSSWKMQSDDFKYFIPGKSSGTTKEAFTGKGLGIFYGFDILFQIKRFKFGFVASQEYFHILKFYNKNLQIYLEPLFSYNEQTHFGKLLLESEFDLIKKKNSFSIQVQGGFLIPERFFVKEYIKKAYTVNAGFVYSIWLSSKVAFIISPMFNYKYLLHKIRQESGYNAIMISQNNPDKYLRNNIYTINLNFGLRIDLLKLRDIKPRFRK